MYAFDPQFYLVASATLFLIALMKGASGGGLAVIGVPVLSLFIPPLQAAAVLAPLVCLMDVFAMMAYPPRTWNAGHLKLLIPGTLVGMAVGTLLIGRAPGWLVGPLIGLIAVVFAGQWLLRRVGLLRTGAGAAPGPVAGYVWGGVSGFTSLLAHAGGPPLAVYILPQNLPKTELAGTQTVYFTVVNYAKIVPYMLLGQFDGPTLLAAALLSPSIPLGVWIGRRLHGRLDQDLIYIVSYTLVFLTGCKMLLDAGRHLAG
ncbi:sulfite exporter TauE/SafE family protein [Azospirillum sp. SYSU D00513]|uniref:sulfite exporter TauE/SafE family protein n=1 Tax=Azospirillum sp. SYSU D00513 TaxID=2812561 RepID=UPI001A960167|nr:sulfite exporter TauE/SafE family protein [Azospirillum sp. SYSU D00513]